MRTTSLVPRARIRSLGRAPALALLGALALACGGDDAPTVGSADGSSGGAATGDSTAGLDESGGVCPEGTQLACECPDGEEGVQICDPATGELGDCLGCPPVPVCGDDFCDEASAESCESCPADCGDCLECFDAPSCEGAAIPGEIDTHFDSLDILPDARALPPLSVAANLASRVEQAELGATVVAAALDPTPAADEHPFVTALREVFARHPEQAAIVRRQLAAAGLRSATDYRRRHPEPRVSTLATNAERLGTTPLAAPGDCNDPKLRIRIAQINVHDEADLVFKDMIYCAVIAEATPGAEIRVTPQTFALDDGDEFAFALAEGVVWGQLGEPVAPQGNLAMTYNCLEGDATGAFEEFLQAIADAADGVGAIPGANGWVLPVIGAAAEVIAAALALENDDHLFNAAQVIPAEIQLDLTNGGWWSVQRTGTFMLKDWHWELRLEAWGCTEDVAP